MVATHSGPEAHSVWVVFQLIAPLPSFGETISGHLRQFIVASWFWQLGAIVLGSQEVGKLCWVS